MEIPAGMKAAVLTAPDKLEIKDVSTPSPGPQDVLINVNAWANVARAISLLESGRISLKSLATHSFRLDEIEEAFKTFTQRIGGAIKVIVKPNTD